MTTLPGVLAPAPAQRATLRPYQEDALRAVADTAARGVRRQLLVAAVGAGKTLVASRIPEWFNDRRLLMICHREELVRQTLKVLQYERPDRFATMERAEDRADPVSDTVAATVQSLSHPVRLARYQAGDWPLLIADEAHRAVAPSYLDIFRHFGHLATGETQARSDGLLLGLTGTARRTDHVALGTVFEEISYTIALRTLIEQGYLSPLRGYLRQAGAHLDGIKTRTNADGDRDYDLQALSAAVNTTARNQFVADVTRGLVLQRGAERPTLVFACDIAHTEALTAAFREAGVTAEALHSRLDRRARQEILQSFRDRRIQVLVNCEILREGVDLPLVSAIVMARPTKSSILFEQVVGRGVRLSPDTGKTDCVVIDFADNTPKHARSMVSLPTLFGLPPLFDLEGQPALAVAKQLDTAAGALETGLDDETFQQIRTPDDIRRIFREFDFWKIAGLPPAISRYSQFAWQRLPAGAYTLLVPPMKPRPDTDPVTLDTLLDPIDPVRQAGGQLLIQENALGHAEVHYRIGPGALQKVHEAPTVGAAFQVADAIVNERYRDRYRLLAKDAEWRRQPASPGQLTLLTKFGVNVKRGLTSGQASLLINNAKALSLERRARYAAKVDEPATPKMRRYLRRLKVTVPPGLTKRQAGRLIRDAEAKRAREKATTS